MWIFTLPLDVMMKVRYTVCIGANETKEEITMAKYLVCNENTLCYDQGFDEKGDAYPLGILAGKTLKGGRSWIEGSFYPSPRDMFRPATVADFNYFNVSVTGHLPELEA